MSLWTPDGERPIRREPSNAATPPSSERPSYVDGTDDFAGMSDHGAPSDAELREQMAQLQAQLLAAPAAAVLVNHVVAFLELAALHLANPDGPTFGEAELALDAAGAVTERLQGRLGDDEAELRSALAQLRLTYVQMKAGLADG